MRKSILLMSAIWLVFTAGVLAQSKPMATPPKVIGRPQCTVENAPVIRGLKLGMSENEAAEVRGGSLEFKPDRDTWTRNAIMTFYNPTGDFAGVNFIYLSSYNGSIFEFKVWYKNDIEWKSHREFVDNFAPKLGLPVEGWDYDVLGAKLTCKDFEVTLDASSNGSVKVTDTRAVRQIAEDMRKTEAERKKAIKP